VLGAFARARITGLNGTTVHSYSLLERREFEPPVLFGLFPL